MEDRLIEQLNKIAALVKGDGAAMKGCAMSRESAIQLSNVRYPGKPYCLVKDWSWFDLFVPDSVKDLLADSEFQPAILYSHSIVLDQKNRFPPDGWVKSSLLTHWDEDGFFITRNTVYILLGEGSRLSTTLGAVEAFH